MVGPGILSLYRKIVLSSEVKNVLDLKVCPLSRVLYICCAPLFGVSLSEVLLYLEGDVMVADLVWQHSLAHRIHCMWYGDLTHDGLSELAVVSTGGIHILQVSHLQCSN